MKTIRFWRHPIAIAAAVFLVLSLCANAFGIEQSKVTQIAIYALYGIGVNLLVAYTGLVPFGASVFFGCASYAAALSTMRLFGSDLAGMAFSVVFSALLAALLGMIILRRRGLYFSLLTLASSQIAFEIAFKWTTFTGGENGLQDVPRPSFASASSFHVFVLVAVLLAMWAIWRLVHSPFGRVIQAIRDNEQRVASMGYNTFRYKLVAFVSAAAFIGFAGALQTYLLQSVFANNLGWEHAADALLMVVLGGVHQFLGPLWGAITFIVLEDVLSSLLENWWLIFAPIIIVLVLVAPGGLHSLFKRKREGWSLLLDPAPIPPRHIPPLAESGATCGERPMLEIRSLKKSFGALVVAAGFDLDVQANQLHSFIGPNGAGKTTFFNMLSGILSSDAGSIRLDGRDITKLAVHERAATGLARSFQIVSVFEHLTVFENVRVAVQTQSNRRFSLWRDAFKNDAVQLRTWSVLKATGLVDLASRLASDLSYGQKRLLEIAITISPEARVLLLDEPLAGLQEADRERVTTLIRTLARTHAVLLIEHDIDRVLEISDRISVLHQGRLIANGTPAEVAANPDVARAYMGTGDAQAMAASKPQSDRSHKATILEVRDLDAGYVGAQILHGVGLMVREGEVVALLGRNGVGKTTLLRALMGVAERTRGEIQLDGQSISTMSTHEINRKGIAIVPEGRRLFPNLSVLENLMIARRSGGGSLDEVFDVFPKLGEIRHRRAEHLSGGERQMVAIARVLMAPSRIILLDEPFEGLAPSIVNEVMKAILRLRKDRSLILVEHQVHKVLPIADHVYVMVNGCVAFEGTAAALHADEGMQARLLGMGGEPLAAAPEPEAFGQA